MRSSSERVFRPDDLAVCRQILKRGSRSFNAAARLLPKRVRDSATIIYAFCRMADDAIDGMNASAETIDVLRNRLDLIYADTSVHDPVDRAFAVVARVCGIPRALPEALIEGFLWDLQGKRYCTLADTRAYGVRVAATVGMMMSLAMDVRDRSMLARACDLGVAMQLTNIARDVGEDAQAGRLYLPLDWLEEQQIDPERWLAAPRYTPALGTIVERLLGEAERLYSRADAGIAMLPPDCRAAIRAARLIYAEIGAIIRARGFDSIRSRAVTGIWRKLRLALAARRPSERDTSRDLEQPPLEEARALVALVPQ